MKLQYHPKPDEAIRDKCRILESIRKTDGEKAYWRLVGEVLKTDPWFLMRVALEWAWLDEDLVGHKFIKHVSDNWGEDLAILFPRGHGKTQPMQAIYISAILNNPHIAILQLSRTDDNARKIGQTTAEHLMYNDFLQRCFGRDHNKNGFLPSSPSQCSSWGYDGYTLPWRKPRNDPTLLCMSAKAAKAGKHPDIIHIDDPTEEENNHEKGWAEVEQQVYGCHMLLPSSGFFIWTGTRWHDSDPLGKVEAGVLQGKQGKFRCIKESCYIDDMPEKGVTYPAKRRWNMSTTTGYTLERLQQYALPKDMGGLGEFFDAQMRNDPLPSEKAKIIVDYINIYKPTELPELSPVHVMGIETTGGGAPIYQGFEEWLEQMKISIPLVSIENPRKIGLEKCDRIAAVLQPIVDSGRLYARDWMIGDKYAKDGLGYELRRLSKGTHDDIADALHQIPAHLAPVGFLPPEGAPADLYISVDLAWKESQRSDYSVAMAVAVDARANYWIVDYDRFKISSPTGIYQRLLEFYNKFQHYSPSRNERKSWVKY